MTTCYKYWTWKFPDFCICKTMLMFFFSRSNLHTCKSFSNRRVYIVLQLFYKANIATSSKKMDFDFFYDFHININIAAWPTLWSLFVLKCAIYFIRRTIYRKYKKISTKWLWKIDRVTSFTFNSFFSAPP